MARPSKIGVRYKINVQLDAYDYDFLKRNSEKFGYTKSEIVRRIIASYRENNYASKAVACLEEEQLQRLNEIATEKGMSIGELTSRVMSNYIDTYF